MPNHFLGNRKQSVTTTINTPGGGHLTLSDAHTQVFNHIGQIAKKAATANTTTLVQMAKKLSKLKI